MIKNNYRYTISDRLGVLIVNPLGESDFTLEWGKEDDEKQYYKQELPSKIRFVEEVYKRFFKLEKSIYRCDYLNITVDRLCGSDYVPWFSGRMTLNDGSWDLDKCNVTLELDDVDEYSCLEDNKTTDVNILQVIYNRKKVKLFNPNVVIETVTHSYFTETETEDFFCNRYAWPDNGSSPQDGGWQVYEHQVNRSENGGFYTCNVTTRYARQKLVQSCSSPQPGSDWILLFDTCWQTGGGPRQQTFVRPASTSGCVYTYPQPGYDSYTMTCEVIGMGTTKSEIDNGVLLSDVLNYFVTNFCPGLTIVSDFFQINPLNPTEINYVTGAMSKVMYLMLFQKTDVKRPSSSNNATIAKINWEKLISSLVTMFNVRYRIEGTSLRIEHVSRFTPGIGLNLNLAEYAKYMVGKNKYTYKKSEIPKREEFIFMESSFGGDFAGVPIIYNSGCVTKESKDNVKKHAVDNITTDVQLCLSNPLPDSKIVSDEGFVMMATYWDGTQYYIVSESSILGGNNLNNSLAWAQLHRDYHRHARPVRTGMMNNTNTTFLSVIPSKQGEKISIPLCCNKDFDPNKLVVTMLGNGEVDKATYSFRTQMLELDLLYVADDNLSGNAPPVAKNKNEKTYINNLVVIQVIEPDSDPDGTIERVEIVYNPAHGTVTVLPDNTIQYYPALGFVGTDYFAYKLYDDWSEPSNSGFVTITVNPANMPPVAGNPVFGVNMGNVLVANAPGAFTGSSDDVSFVLDTYQNISAHGGSVVLNANGSFTYTPVVDFFGVDTFQFTIKDDQGLTATGTVTINVINPNYPIARPDNYQTVRNASLTISASDGLLINDGGTGTNVATVESKTTTGGGTVNIAANGSFTYIPLSGFTGTDTFKYTVSNGSGSVQGDVTIIVLPVVYARLDLSSYRYEVIYEMCGGANTFVGEEQLATLNVKFFSDSAGVTPLNVTGLDLRLTIKVTESRMGQSPQYFYYQPIAHGSDYVVDNAFVASRQYDGCDGQGSYQFFRNALLEPGLYTII